MAKDGFGLGKSGDSTDPFRVAFDASGDMLLVLDGARRIQRANRGRGEAPADTLEGRLCCDIFPECSLPKRDCPVAKAFKSGVKASHEVLDSGGLEVMNIAAHPVCDEGGKVLSAVLRVRDDMPRRAIEARLSQSARLAAIGEMAAGVAHELNSPLTAVIGNSNLLLRRFPDEDPTRQLLLDIKNCGQRCKNIIKSLLTFARQDDYVFLPLSLNEVVGTGLDLIAFQLEQRDIVIERQLCPGLPMILGNPQEIEQVVVNLVLNARDALSSTENRVITVATDYSTLDGAQLGLVVLVRDTGTGIAPEALARIFDPFFTTKEGERGTGLGLSVSMGIAKAHGGTITVESTPGQGSTFALRLPLMEQRLLFDLGDEAGKANFAPGGDQSLDKLRSELRLAHKLGSLVAQMTDWEVHQVEIECRGEAAGWSTGLITAAVLEGLLSGGAPPGSMLGDIRALAAERSIRVVESKNALQGGFGPAISVRVTGVGKVTAVSGALVGRREPRLVDLDGFAIEAPLTGHLLVVWAADRPGLVGDIASVLAAGANGIRQMRSSMDGTGPDAVAVFGLDGPASEGSVMNLLGLSGIKRVKKVYFR